MRSLFSAVEREGGSERASRQQRQEGRSTPNFSATSMLRSQLHACLATSMVRRPTLRPFRQLLRKSANSSWFRSTPRVLAQLHAFRPNSTRFGSTPHVFFAQLHAFSRSNSTPPQTQATRHIKGRNARVAHASHARASRAAARLRAKRGKEARETTHRATERSPETHPARGPRTATKESGLPADSPRGARVARRVSRAPHARSWSGCLRRGEERSEGAACAERREESSEAQNARHANTGRELRERTARLPARRARRVARCVRRAPARGERAPAGAREERGSGACGARQTGREKHQGGEDHSARTPLLDCGGDEPPEMHVRRARRARAARYSARAAPSLRTERRPKRRRKTRTTTGDRSTKEDKTTTARDVRAELRRREPPTLRGAFDRSTI